jgi:hypothetical protein
MFTAPGWPCLPTARVGGAAAIAATEIDRRTPPSNSIGVGGCRPPHVAGGDAAPGPCQQWFLNINNNNDEPPSLTAGGRGRERGGGGRRQKRLGNVRVMEDGVGHEVGDLRGKCRGDGDHPIVQLQNFRFSKI